MNDELLIQSLGEGRLSEIKENRKTLLVGTYKATKDKENSLIYLEELKALADSYGVETVISLPCPLKK